MSNETKKRITSIVTLVIVIIAIFLAWDFFFKEKSSEEELTYDRVVTYVKTNEVTKIELEQNSLEISVTLKDETKMKAIVPSMDEFTAFISEEIKNGNAMNLDFFSTISSVPLW